MKYIKCPRCGLNYIRQDQTVCFVCQNEIEGKPSIFDEQDDNILCPYCEKYFMGVDDVMCANCQKRRNRRFDDC